MKSILIKIDDEEKYLKSFRDNNVPVFCSDFKEAKEFNHSVTNNKALDNAMDILYSDLELDVVFMSKNEKNTIKKY